MFVGIEGRGTEFVCLIGRTADDILTRSTVPTTTPDETLGRVVDVIRDASARFGPVRAAGVACFGPLDLAKGSVTYTLKPGWQGFPIVNSVRQALSVPVVLDTDVNAAAVAEGRARGVRSLLFITIGTGTGIGAGALADGRPVHGLSHPEMGHLPVTRHLDDPMAGRCPYHGDCLEGLATGKAMVERWGEPAGDWGAHAVRLEGWYLAQLATAATYMLSPELIVLDGGVARAPGMIVEVRAATLERLADDPAVAGITADIDAYIDGSSLDGDAAARGALVLATEAV